jgi:hypothetical protein
VTTSSRQGAKAADARTATQLLVAMTGKASPAKAAEGNEPVFGYIASMSQPQRGIAERIDALAARTLPDLQARDRSERLGIWPAVGVRLATAWPSYRPRRRRLGQVPAGVTLAARQPDGGAADSSHSNRGSAP